MRKVAGIKPGQNRLQAETTEGKNQEKLLGPAHCGSRWQNGRLLYFDHRRGLNAVPCPPLPHPGSNRRGNRTSLSYSYMIGNWGQVRSSQLSE